MQERRLRLRDKIETNGIGAEAGQVRRMGEIKDWTILCLPMMQAQGPPPYKISVDSNIKTTITDVFNNVLE